jgi:hypothetical protein
MAGGAGGFGGFGGVGTGVGVGGVRGASSQAGPPTGAKRQRLMNAAMYEEQRNTAIRYAQQCRLTSFWPVYAYGAALVAA